jgi:hypothetical protein
MSIAFDKPVHKYCWIGWSREGYADFLPLSVKSVDATKAETSVHRETGRDICTQVETNEIETWRDIWSQIDKTQTETVIRILDRYERRTK